MVQWVKQIRRWWRAVSKGLVGYLRPSSVPEPPRLSSEEAWRQWVGHKAPHLLHQWQQAPVAKHLHWPKLTQSHVVDAATPQATPVGGARRAPKRQPYRGAERASFLSAFKGTLGPKRPVADEQPLAKSTHGVAHLGSSEVVESLSHSGVNHSDVNQFGAEPLLADAAERHWTAPVAGAWGTATREPFSQAVVVNEALSARAERNPEREGGLPARHSSERVQKLAAESFRRDPAGLPESSPSFARTRQEVAVQRPETGFSLESVSHYSQSDRRPEQGEQGGQGGQDASASQFAYFNYWSTELDRDASAMPPHPVGRQHRDYDEVPEGDFWLPLPEAPDTPFPDGQQTQQLQEYWLRLAREQKGL